MDLIGLTTKDPEWYQVAVRTVIVFFVALTFIRISGMRTFGTQSAFDVVVSITLGAVLSRGIMGHYPFINCLVAGGLLVVLHRVVGYLSAKNKMIKRLTEGEPRILFEKGKWIRPHLEKYSLTEGDVYRALHQENLDSLEKVKRIIFEIDGTVTIIKNETQQ